jgi:hypothetical protein
MCVRVCMYVCVCACSGGATQDVRTAPGVPHNPHQFCVMFSVDTTST